MTNAERRAPDGDRPASALARALRFGKSGLRSCDAAAAMRKAPGFEAEGREMYLRMSKAAPGRQEKAFFRLPSLEEQVHFEILCEYLDYLEATGLRMRE
jgi:rubrerythrin